MVLQLRPERSPALPAPISPPARPAASAAPSVPPATQTTATPAPTANPAGLRGDRFALVFWLTCVGVMAVMLLWDLVVTIFK